MRRHLKPALTRPLDFQHFWAKTKWQLEQIEPELRRSPLPQTYHPALVLENLTFVSLGHARVQAYLIRWKDGGERPLVVHSHGYMGKCRIMWPWALAGLNVVGVDVRGFGRSLDALPIRSRWGYILTGLESPEQYVLRGAICDYLQAYRVGCEVLGGSPEKAVFHGESFAGALALMAEAIWQMADLLALGVPTFGWAEGRQFFVKSGSGEEIKQFLAHRPEQAEDLMMVLRYFDPMNFAEFVTCPTLVGVGLADDVVPAHTVYAIANHLGGRHEIMEFPVSHSESPEAQHWDKFEEAWLRLALGEIPSDFGAHPERRVWTF